MIKGCQSITWQKGPGVYHGKIALVYIMVKGVLMYIIEQRTWRILWQKGPGVFLGKRVLGNIMAKGTLSTS